MKNVHYLDRMLGEIVADDFRTAEIFMHAGIDFCCGGKKSLGQACVEKSIEPQTVLSQIEALAHTPLSPGLNFKEWDLGFLADYIVNTHHKYVLKSLPELVFYTQKIADVHGERHPELLEVATLFSRINTELIQHLGMEEKVLFPAIKEALQKPTKENTALIHSEIERMNGEHEFAGGAMDKINEITGSYAVPADGCSTYQVCFKYLQEFENDLHVHVHLENNILFPKALEIHP